MRNIIAVIPARANSKRLPNKNARLMHGIPLIAHTINQATKSNCFSDVIVSTDSDSIAEIARRYGATVPGLRPAELATDQIQSIHVVLHLLKDKKYKDVDAVMLLQPTSPHREISSIQEACRLLSNKTDSVISISPASTPPSWLLCKGEDDTLSKPEFVENIPSTQRYFQPNGAIYLTKTAALKQYNDFYGKQTKALLMDEIEAIDIDTPIDWLLASAVFEKEQVECV